MFEKFLNKSKKNTKAVCIAIALCLFLGTVLSFLPNFNAYADTNSGRNYERSGLKTVTLAVFELEGFAQYDSETDEWSGIEIRMFNKIAKYANWNVEFVKVNNYNEGLALIDKHEVDFIGGVQLEAESQKKYLYGDIACGFLYNAIAVRNSDAGYTYGDITGTVNKKIGVNKAYLGQGVLIDELEASGVDSTTIEIVEYATDNELYAALQRNEIDFIAGQMLMMDNRVRPIKFFTPKPYFFMSYKGNEATVEEMDEAIMKYMVEFPDEVYANVSEYFLELSPGKNRLTSKELNYIANKREITVAFVTNAFPFSYVENGVQKGVVINVLNRLSENTNLSINLVNVDSVEAGIEMLNSEEDVVLSYCTDDIAKQYNLKSSTVRNIKKYANSQYGIVIQKDSDANGISVVVASDELQGKNIEQYFGTAVGVQYYSTEECMNLVRKGKVDACIVDAYLYEQMVDSDYAYRDLSLSGTIDLSRDVYFAISSVNASSNLAGILEKVVEDLDSADVAQYVLANTDMKGYYHGRMVRFISIIFLIIVALTAVFIKLFHDNKKIQTLTSRDAELGIWNTSYFLYQTNLHVRHSTKTDYAVVYLYLSQFRVYSNINGFEKSHRLLEHVLNVLVNRCLAGSDEKYSRSYGGRFLLLLRVDDKDRFTKRLEGMRRLLTDEIKTIDTSPMPISFGVCFLDKDDLDVSKATARANMALDTIKNTSAGETVFFNDEFEKKILLGYEKEKVLDDASIRDDFVVYYQSKVDIRTKQIVGAEALVRFADPTDGGKIKSPYFFIDYFEQNGRIRKLDFHVLNVVCKMLRKRLDEGKEVVPISVNFSRLHFEDPNFISQLELVVDSYELPRELIEVEVTETAMVEGFNNGRAIELMDMLIRYGFHLSVDDFGTGYSSLGILEQIPASVIKLDRSFFRNEKDRERKVSILKNFVIMARELNVMVVCEGVEFEEDVELMRMINVYVAQGYRYSKPEPGMDFENRLDAQFAN